MTTNQKKKSSTHSKTHVTRLVYCTVLKHYLFIFEHSPSYDSNLRQDHNRLHAKKKSDVGPTLLKRRVREVPNYQTRKFKNQQSAPDLIPTVV